MQFNLANPFTIFPLDQFPLQEESLPKQIPISFYEENLPSEEKTNVVGKRAISQVSSPIESSFDERDSNSKKKIKKGITEKKSTQSKIESVKNKSSNRLKKQHIDLTSENPNTQLLDKNRMLEQKVQELQAFNGQLNEKLEEVCQKNEILKKSLKALEWIRNADFNWYMQMLLMHAKIQKAQTEEPLDFSFAGSINEI